MSTAQGVGFITGAGSNLGAVIACCLVENGCTRLALVDSSPEASNNTAAKVLAESTGRFISIEHIPYGINSDSSIDEAVKQAVNRFGSINYCINISPLLPQFGASLDVTAEQWNEVLRANQRATWLNTRGVLRQLLYQQEDNSKIRNICRSSIVNITTSHGLGAQPGFPVSAASSHAIVGMTKTVAMDYVSSGVCVNAVCAGPMASDHFDITVENSKHLLEVVPMGRLIEAGEVASAVLWLLSDEAAAVTGLAVPVDGGWGLCHH